MRRQWVFDPHSGGVKIPPAVRTRTVERIEKFAAKQYAGKYVRLDIRFRGPLCYIDAYVEPAEPSARMLKVTGEIRQQFLERLYVRTVCVRGPITSLTSAPTLTRVERRANLFSAARLNLRCASSQNLVGSCGSALI